MSCLPCVLPPTKELSNILLLMLVCATGCGRRTPAAPAVPPTAPAVSPAAPVAPAVPLAASPADAGVSGREGTIAVKIDGVALSRKEIVRRGKTMMQLNMNKMRRRRVGKSELKYLDRYCREAIAREIAQAAVRRYVDAHRLTVASGTVERVRRDFVRRYGVRSPKLHRWHTIDDLRYMLGVNADRLDEELRNRVLYATATNHILSAAAIRIDDREIARRKADLVAYNERAAATNRLVFARASNVWHQVASGQLAFEDAARRYSEDKYLQDGIEWGLFTREQLADEPQVAALLPSLATGDITPPVESDGGLAILRVDPADSEDQIAFSRIFFRLPAYAEIGSDADLRREIRLQRERETVERTLRSVAETLTVEYPDGRDVFDFSDPSRRLTGKEIQECDR